MKNSCIVCLLLGIVVCTSAQNKAVPLNAGLKKYIHSITMDQMPGVFPKITTTRVTGHITHVSLSYNLPKQIALDDWQVRITPAFRPAFHWAPMLTPTSKNIIAQHVFRSPALIVSNSQLQLSIIPDLDMINRQKSTNWYMDLDAPANTLTLGMSKSELSEHVQYIRQKGMILSPGTLEFGFYIISEKTENAATPWRSTEAFIWKTWGNSLYKNGEPTSADPGKYVDHAYNWAFNTWRNAVWQEFELKGKRVGAPVFIVNYTQSPNYRGPVNEREFRSVWNQAWFSSLRSASGLYRYARRTKNDSLLQKAILAKELTLSFPQTNGLFPGLIGTEMETDTVNNKAVNRSKGWNTYYFGNSDRSPDKTSTGPKDAPYHILDMSWTAGLMLDWYKELEKDTRLLDYAQRYADKLLTFQDADGFFPAWLDTKTLKPFSELQQSPETAESVNFLLKLYKLTGKDIYKSAGLKALHAVMKDIILDGRWEDFETYWSCSGVYRDSLGKKMTRNDQYKQNTLSMYWTAGALYEAFMLTKDKNYLQAGQRCLDELLMYQAGWQPPFIYVHAFGGFGVMNGDGEWNDARQSLFAELIIRYGKLLNNEEYTQRGIAALRASFVMMYCPENPETKAQWEKVYPFFNEKDYGFMMENYGHEGVTGADGIGIGEFTIFDWGNGAAAEAYNRIIDHFGQDFFR